MICPARTEPGHDPNRGVTLFMVDTKTTGIQVMGGIGCTWEHDMHIHLERAKSNQVAFGDSAFHREAVALLLGF
jgi:alkylation response protein AidB-like acyl-CoA dehydrogenase